MTAHTFAYQKYGLHHFLPVYKDRYFPPFDFYIILERFSDDWQRRFPFLLKEQANVAFSGHPHLIQFERKIVALTRKNIQEHAH